MPTTKPLTFPAIGSIFQFNYRCCAVAVNGADESAFLGVVLGYDPQEGRFVVWTYNAQTGGYGSGYYVRAADQRDSETPIRTAQDKALTEFARRAMFRI